MTRASAAPRGSSGGAAASDDVADTLDYKLVTVTVTHPAMRKVVAKTTAVAAF